MTLVTKLGCNSCALFSWGGQAADIPQCAAFPSRDEDLTDEEYRASTESDKPPDRCPLRNEPVVVLLPVPG